MAQPCVWCRADMQILSASFLSSVSPSLFEEITEFRAVTPLEDLVPAQMSLRQQCLP